MRQLRHRVLEISDQVRTVLEQSAAECSITPAPADSEQGDSATSIAARCACKDAIPVSPLARLVEKRTGGGSTAASSSSSFGNLQVRHSTQAWLLVMGHAQSSGSCAGRWTEEGATCHAPSLCLDVLKQECK